MKKNKNEIRTIKENIKSCKRDTSYMIKQLGVYLDNVRNVLDENMNLCNVIEEMEHENNKNVNCDNDDYAIDEFFTYCRKLLEDKNTEYTRKGDRFGVFENARIMQKNITEEQALWGFVLKQFSSVAIMIDSQAKTGTPYTLYSWREKCADIVNYMALLYAMEEKKDNIRKTNEI